MKNIYVSKIQLLFFSFLAMVFFFLLYGIQELSISYDEAKIFFNENNFLHFIVKASCFIFGQNDFALRLPFVILYYLSTLLLYRVSNNILKKNIDKIIAVCVFMVLPGTLASSLLVNDAGVIIFLTLLFVWLYENKCTKTSYFILFLMLFVNNSFYILYLSLFFYSVSKKDKNLLIITLFLFTVAMYWHGFGIEGKPRGYFLDTIGVYSAVFSPLIFLYFMYTMYRIAIKEEKNILWYISFGALIFSLIFSLRQKLPLEDFLPFSIISVPLMVKIFLNSFRVRLPKFRKLHFAFCIFVLLSLCITSFFTILNKTFYPIVNLPNKHFVYKYHVAKDLALWLKKQNIYQINLEDKKMEKRLEFYGIKKGGPLFLVQVSLQKAKEKDFAMEVLGKKIIVYEVKKNL